MRTAEPTSSRRKVPYFGVWLAWFALCAAMVEIGHVVWPGTLAGGIAASSAGVGTSVIVGVWRRRTRTR